MFRIATIFLAVLCAGSPSGAAAAQAVKPVPRIEVTAPGDVAMVEVLNDALAALSEKVTACVNAGRKTETCRCSYPQELTRLRTSYARLIQRHPEWKDQLLSYHRLDKDGRNISGTLVLESLRRQLEVLQCK